MRRFAMRLLTLVVCVNLYLGAQPNILNNGGFEDALMCYVNTVWSTTGIFYRGDYKFRISPDSHSGLNSIEIRCEGPDCFKAASISNKIPTTPNQQYKLSVYAKCPSQAPADRLAAVYIPGTAGGDTFRVLPCDGNWNRTEIAFTTGPVDKEFFYYLFSYYAGQGGWVRYDDVVLTYGDGTAPADTTLYPGVRDVRMSDQTLLVDGVPYFDLGFFDVNYEDIPLVAATGATSIHALGLNPHARCFNTTQKNYLDRAYENGLNFVPESSSSAQAGAINSFASILQRFGPHRANIAWMITDEPDQAFVPWFYILPSIFVSEYNAAKSQTTLPLIANFQRAAWANTSDVAPYASGVDFWMGEPYGPAMEYANHAINMFNSLKRRPIWFAQDDPDVNVIVPKAYWVVIGGVTGITYFTWDTFKAQPAKLAAVQQVFSELKQLKNVIFGQKMDSVVSPPNGIASMARYSGNATYVLAANSTATPIQGKFLVQGLTAGQQISVLFENRAITAAAGEFTDNFPGVSRHVYVINAPLTTLSATIASKTGPDNARVWRIQAYASGIGAANSAAISSLTLTQTGGTACAPTIAAGTFPRVLGTIPSGSSVFGDIPINFTGCDNTSRFRVEIVLSANNGAARGAIVRNNERK